MFTIAAREKNLRLTVTIAPPCPAWVEGDPVRLRQILINLLGNAIKFTTAGEVGITLAPADAGMLHFEVSDTGIGIAPEKLRSIFEAFTRSTDRIRGDLVAADLDWPSRAACVALMGGKIAVQSEPGRGTRFPLEFPLKPAVQPECPPSAAQLSSAAGLPLEILVAEDNAVNQAVIRGVDGLEATTRIRAEESRRALGRTPIIAFTAHAVGARPCLPWC